MLDSTDNILLALLRREVKNDIEDIIDGFTCNNTLWELSKDHGISAFILDGLQSYISDNQLTANSELLPQKAMLQWISQMMALEQLHKKQEIAIAKLARLYGAKDIRLMVLKGYGLSLDWPVPNHRSVGDIDIYHFGKWKEADDLIEKSCNIKVDESHEHHTTFTFDGFFIENHYDFINTKAHRDAPSIEAELKELAHKDYREVEIDGAKIYLPSANFNAIFLMRHMGQHFAGERLILRQLLDWGFFMRAHSQEVAWNSTIDFLIQVGLYRFFHQINAICVDHLGFSESCFPKIKREEALERRILEDILHPEFDEKKPSSGLKAILAFKFRRWWHNRWKHQLVYNDSLVTSFLTLSWSHIRRFESIKD